MPIYRDPYTGKTRNVTQEQYNYLTTDKTTSGYGFEARLQKFAEQSKQQKTQKIRADVMEKEMYGKYGGKEEVGKQDLIWREKYPGWDKHTNKTKQARKDAMAVLYQQYAEAIPSGEPKMTNTEFVSAVLNNPDSFSQFEANVPSFRKVLEEREEGRQRQQIAGILSVIAAPLTISGVIPPKIGSLIVGASAKEAGMPPFISTALGIGTGTAAHYEATKPEPTYAVDPQTGETIVTPATTTTPSDIDKIWNQGQADISGGERVVTSLGGAISPEKKTDDLTAKIMSGEITWKDALKEVGQAGIQIIAEKIYSAPENREARQQYEQQRQYQAEDIAFAERLAAEGRTRVSQDYARQMDELRRSQHVQNLYKREALAERGITPDTKSTIGESEWRRLSEQQEAERTGADVLRERKLKDIESQLEGTRMQAQRAGTDIKERFEDKYKTWEDIIRSRTSPSAVAGVAGEALGI